VNGGGEIILKQEVRLYTTEKHAVEKVSARVWGVAKKTEGVRSASGGKGMVRSMIQGDEKQKGRDHGARQV